jgi:hypothetical protein
MKKIVIALAIVGCAFAGSVGSLQDSHALSVGVEPLDEDTAHWQAYNDDGEDCAACVVDGGDTYSMGDKTWMYNSTALDISTAQMAGLAFEYKLDNADANDYLAVYAVNYEPTSGSFDPDAETPLATYDTTVDWTLEELGLEDLLGESTVYVVFHWESDNTGVDAGPRINTAGVWSWDGSYDWTNLLYWDEDHDAYGPGEEVNLDLSAVAGSWGVVEFHYDDEGSWAWWAAVDQVVISDDTRADLLTEDFEDWPPTDWEIVDYGGTGYVWESNSTTGRTNYAGGDGLCAVADSDWDYPMNTGLITPLLDFSGSTSIALDFTASYNDLITGGGDYFEVNLGEVTWNPEIDDPFDDLSAWTTVDEGVYSPVKDSSWGYIKTLE